jgi:hypothetical protein
MILLEIVHTCSHPAVASAALASIGGEFAAYFEATASRCNVSPGVLVARMVEEFSSSANHKERSDIGEAARVADQPILAGLRYILSVIPRIGTSAGARRCRRRPV